MLMNKQDVFELLEQNQNQRGIEHWQKMENTCGLTSYGMGLTVHRKLAKQIGRNHQLALELWNTNNYDAKVIGLLIDDPKQLTEEQIESQVEGLGIGLLTHVFSSCDATLPKAPFAFELAKKWLLHSDPIRRRCAYGLIYEFSKKNNKKITDEFYFEIIGKIETDIFDEPINNRVSMGAALMGIGKRSKALNAEALKVARVIGPIDFNQPGQKCEPMNIEKHLTSDHLKQKLGL
jgi:3-methyladenine DNA glycosylase AlkD